MPQHMLCILCRAVSFSFPSLSSFLFEQRRFGCIGLVSVGHEMGGTCCADRRVTNTYIVLVGNNMEDVGSYWIAGGWVWGGDGSV
jgi:hypothetical protein